MSLGIRTASKAQHGAITPAQKHQTKYVRADQSTYPKTFVRVRRRGCFPGAWSLWHLKVACLHLKCSTIYCICHSNPFFLVSERIGRNRPIRKAPCIHLTSTV